MQHGQPRRPPPPHARPGAGSRRRCHRSPARRRRAGPAPPARSRRGGSPAWPRRTPARRTPRGVSRGSLPALRTGTKPVPSARATGAARMKPARLHARRPCRRRWPRRRRDRPSASASMTAVKPVVVGEQRGDVLEDHARARGSRGRRRRGAAAPPARRRRHARIMRRSLLALGARLPGRLLPPGRPGSGRPDAGSWARCGRGPSPRASSSDAVRGPRCRWSSS